MKLRPILFSTPMVQAILKEQKTQTRRLVKPQPNFDAAWRNLGGNYDIPSIDCQGTYLGLSKSTGGVGVCVPNIKVPVHSGDILWVRETWADVPFENSQRYHGYAYRADDHDQVTWKWKPSIFMPRKVCRIFLEVTDVRVERLHEISVEDAEREGVSFQHSTNSWDEGYYDYLKKSFIQDLSAYDSFKTLWMSINGIPNWCINPYVWVYEFKYLTDYEFKSI